MKLLSARRLLLLVLIGASAVAEDQADAGIEWREDLKKAIAEASKTRAEVFVFVTTSDCAPCELMESETFVDKTVQKTLRRFICVRSKKADLANKVALRRIVSFPTCLVVRDGECRVQFRGFLPPRVFLDQLEATRAALRSIEDASKKIRRSPKDLAARLLRGRGYFTTGDFVRTLQDVRVVAEAKDATKDQRGAAELLALDVDLSVAGFDPEDQAGWKKLEGRFKRAERRIKGTTSEGEMHMNWYLALAIMGRMEEAREHLVVASRLPHASAEGRKRATEQLRLLAEGQQEERGGGRGD